MIWCTASGSTECAPGMKLVGDECIPCIAGTISLGGSVSTCSPCPINTYQPLPSMSVCLPCPSGTTSMAGATVCIRMYSLHSIPLHTVSFTSLDILYMPVIDIHNTPFTYRYVLCDI